tara:strand:+ start:437 stop:898 length:462 start_codon:yes stop_codon:yes gene_type:complete
MKTILSKAKQETFLDDNWKVKTLHFKWAKTGSHKCWLYDRNDNVLGSAGGGGYDKKGTALGQFMNTYLNDELKKINSTDYYGITHWNKVTKKRQNRASKHTKTYVDGGCGFQSMQDILCKIGFSLVFVKETKWETFYIMEELPRKHYSRTRLK